MVRQLYLERDGHTRNAAARRHHRGLVRLLRHGVAREGRHGSFEEVPGVAHFAIPASHWWDDIVFQLKTMLLFWSEEHGEKWCEDRTLLRGEILSLDKCWRMAKARYGPDRREAGWRRRSAEETKALFAELGLTSLFWRLPG